MGDPRIVPLMEGHDRSLTTHEVGRLLAVHPFTIGRYVDDGTLKGFKTAGGHRRVLASELRRYMEAHQMPVPPELEAGDDRLRLLIVDDDAAVLRALKRVFKPLAAEVEVLTTDSPIEALLMVGAQRPDALLFDLEMPVLNGLELLRRLRGAKGKGLRLIAMTGLGRTDVIGSALREGALAVLEKPIDPVAVLAQLRAVLPKRRVGTRRGSERRRLPVAAPSP